MIIRLLIYTLSITIIYSCNFPQKNIINESQHKESQHKEDTLSFNQNLYKNYYNLNETLSEKNDLNKKISHYLPKKQTNISNILSQYQNHLAIKYNNYAKLHELNNEHEIANILYKKSNFSHQKIILPEQINKEDYKDWNSAKIHKAKNIARKITNIIKYEPQLLMHNFDIIAELQVIYDCWTIRERKITSIDSYRTNTSNNNKFFINCQDRLDNLYKQIFIESNNLILWDPYYLYQAKQENKKSQLAKNLSYIKEKFIIKFKEREVTLDSVAKNNLNRLTTILKEKKNYDMVFLPYLSHQEQCCKDLYSNLRKQNIIDYLILNGIFSKSIKVDNNTKDIIQNQTQNLENKIYNIDKGNRKNPQIDIWLLEQN